MFNDLRFALRMLRKNPGFSIIAVLTLALGICGVTTQFSVIDAALLRGLPFTEPDRLVRVAMRDPSWPSQRDQNPILGDIQEFRAAQMSFTDLASYFTAGSFILTVKDTPERLSGSHVTPGFFSILGVKPVMGRDFVDADHQPSAERVIIISDALWRSDFETDPNVIGRQVRVNGKVATVIGVMAPGFQFPRDLLWTPMFNEYPLAPRPSFGNAAVLARLKPGVSIDQANAEFELFLQRQAQRYPEVNGKLTMARVQPLLFTFVGQTARQLLIVMFAAVALVLMIACANVMNMQFARATVRWRELAVRAALGASRMRLVRQMLTESLVLAALGGALGAAMAHWAVGLFSAVMAVVPGQAMPSWMIFRVDWPALAFTVVATAFAVLLSGLLPAVLASRTNLVDALKESARGTTGGMARRLTAALVVGQIALTCPLLICSLLMIRSITNQFAQKFGFDLDSVVVGRMNFEAEYRDNNDDRLIAIHRVLNQLRSSDAFTDAAFTTRRGMMTNESIPFQIEGHVYSKPADQGEAWFEIISDRYFKTLGLKPLDGREFDPSDTGDRQNVALVNESWVRRFSHGESPIGRRIRNGDGNPWLTIIGVVPDTQMQGPVERNRDGAGIFLPIDANPFPYLSLVVRGRGPVSQLAPMIRTELAKAERGLPIYNLGTPRQFFEAALSQNRTVASLFSLFAGAAVVLAAVGLYGVMSFAVGRRTQEIGVRMALGARAGQIVGMVLRQGAWQLLIGTAVGVVVTLVLIRFGSAVVDSFLYNVSPGDPLIYAAVIALMAVATALACFFPARKAARVDPMVALRTE